MVTIDKIPKRSKIDKKNIAILVLSIIVLIFIGNYLYSSYQASQQNIFLQGVQRGQLQEQQKAITQLQGQGYYEIVVIDESTNQQVPVKLVVQK